MSHKHYLLDLVLSIVFGFAPSVMLSFIPEAAMLPFDPAGVTADFEALKSGGPSVKPEKSMQKLVTSGISLAGYDTI